MSADNLYFSLTFSGRVIDSLRAAANRADAVGRLSEVLDEIRTLQGWLRADPETLGEPYRVHSGNELTEYIGFVGPLIVRYNIRHASKHVFVLYPIRVVAWAGF